MATWQSVSPQKDRSGWAVSALVLGVVNLGSWLLPVCGGPLALVGIVAGALGLKSARRTLAVLGLVLSILGLLLSIGNALFGVFLALKKQDATQAQQPAPQMQHQALSQPNQPLPAQPAAQAQPALPTGGAALDVRYSTSPTPTKGQPFHLILEVANLGGDNVRICAVNFRGRMTSIWDQGLVSPAGQEFWVSGGEDFERGAVFAPCVTIPPGKTQQFVFGLRSFVSATWNGEVGFCSEAPSEDNPETVLSQCFYLPVSITVR